MRSSTVHIREDNRFENSKFDVDDSFVIPGLLLLFDRMKLLGVSLVDVVGVGDWVEYPNGRRPSCQNPLDHELDVER